MNKIIISTAIVAFIIGLMAAMVGYHAYIVYQLKTKVAQNEAVLGQVVNFLNQSVAAQESKIQTPPLKIQTPASTTKVK